MIRPARDNELDIVRDLFCEYQRFLGFDLCFQGFEEELRELPGCYASPTGTILVAEIQGNVVGCIALRPLGGQDCEMKRLYVRPEGRSHGLGRKLCLALLQTAREMGYRRMKLDTVSKLQTAIALYRQLGFRECEKYCENPQPDVLYFELDLTSPISAPSH